MDSGPARDYAFTRKLCIQYSKLWSNKTLNIVRYRSLGRPASRRAGHYRDYTW
jgi:hypothetical protein